MLRSLPTLLAALAALLLTAPAASAKRWTAPCRGDGTGPTCTFWTAKAVSVNDGDTIGVDIDGDGTHREFQVRFTGVQAMELTRHSDTPSKRRGQCHGLEATNLVQSMMRRTHWRVRIAAQHASSHADKRLQRSIWVHVGGRWRDLGTMLMTKGDTLFMGTTGEWAWNETYNRLGQQARLKGIGMWDPTHCGSGPDQDVPLRVWAQWDPPGVDSQHVDDEWIKVQNLDTARSISLAHWWLRDSMLRRFTFPSGTVLGPGQTTTVHTGSGARDGLTFHWGLHVTLFPNLDGIGLGDGAYLFDPRGDLRQAMVYPCLVACTDPAQGTLAVSAEPRGNESVRVRNVSGRPVDLYGYAVSVPAALLPFAEGTVLAPGQSISVGLPIDHNLPDSGGNVRVVTFSDVTVACDAWGSGGC